jgi:myosin heavy subunit
VSLLAKIFVIVLTVLSLVFLGTQATLYYHQNDWRAAYVNQQARMRLALEEKQQEIQAAQAAIKDLEKKREELAGTVRQVQTISKATEDAFQNKQAELNRLQQQYATLESAHKAISQTIEEKDRTLAQFEARIKDLSDQLKTATAEKEQAEAQNARLTTIKTTLEKDLAEVRKDYTATKQKLLDAELVLDELRNQGVPISTLVVNHKPMPPINGKVAGVKSDVQPALVLLTVGKDDKVERGFTFTIYRGNQFIGKVVVEKLMADSCGCRVLFTAAGQQIKAGDDAATRLD